MAATATKISGVVPGNRTFYDFDFNADTSYPTGGYDLSAASLWGLNFVTKIKPICFTAGMASGVADFLFVRATSKLQFFTAAGAQVANATDLSSVKIMVEVHGG